MWVSAALTDRWRWSSGLVGTRGRAAESSVFSRAHSAADEHQRRAAELQRDPCAHVHAVSKLFHAHASTIAYTRCKAYTHAHTRRQVMLRDARRTPCLTTQLMVVCPPPAAGAPTPTHMLLATRAK